MSREFLYRRLGWAVIVILSLPILAPARSAAQEPQLKRPHEDRQERPSEIKKTKKEKGPRAVGLLQLNSSGKTALIPVAILIDGKFYDASVYKADPLPMALEGGTVYEVERAGESQGLFTIRGALHSQSPGSPNPWLGTGSYVLNGAEVAKTTHRAEDMPVGLDNSTDAPPRLTRGKEAKAATPPDAGPASSSGTSSGASSGTPGGAGSSEKPGTAAAPSQPASGSSADGASGQAGQKPATAAGSDKAAAQGGKDQAPAAAGQAAGGPSSQGQASQGQASQGEASHSQGSESQGSQNYYRPTLRRGKPTETAPQEKEDVSTPKVEKPGSAATATAATVTPSQLVPAISDAGGPEPQSYKFFWKEGEEDERRKQMLALAADEVRAYVSEREKGAIPVKPAVAKAGGTKGAATARKSKKKVELVFENVQFRVFDVWKNNQPVMILSAEAHLPPAEPGPATAPELYNVSIVARTDIYGSLRRLYSGVTDKFHLDVTPRLELIDAVDADGDGRGELLFRETTDAGSGYVIYRATADKLWKMFDSLGAE